MPAVLVFWNYLLLSLGAEVMHQIVDRNERRALSGNMTMVLLPATGDLLMAPLPPDGPVGSCGCLPSSLLLPPPTHPPFFFWGGEGGGREADIYVP